MKRTGAMLYGALASFVGAVAFGVSVQTAQAQSSFPNPGPKDGAVGVQGVKPAPAPSIPATIVTPAPNNTTNNGSVTVTGSCQNNLLVKIFANEIFVGADLCERGTYSIPISLFNGKNDLVARVYDDLEQEGPDSNLVSVTFNDAQFDQFGSHVSITSPYARRGVDPGQELTWPVIISGGIGPYAMTVDWGDGTAPQLYSVSGPGQVTLKHTYKNAATYDVFIRVADKNQTEGFLRVVSVAAGNTSGVETKQKESGSGKVPVDRAVLLVAVLIVAILLPTSFWLGRRYELAYLRHQIERDTQL